MATVKTPTKCPDCGSTSITPMGGTALPLSAEGKREPIIALVFKCDDCGNLIFKSAN
ncbi:hypothetical protein NSS91_15985 [Caldifermentibacillus hisashii]|uniref:hypothetical protein n=1 Tax=Caldifermentibacillus hisashii TaxID=996558 RepID=UPI0031FDE8AA